MLAARFTAQIAKLAIVAAVVGMYGVATVRAQTTTQPGYGMTSPLDLYGNAQSLYPERRPVGIFQNEIQREALRGYQTLNRRIGQRGIESPFLLPSDRFMQSLSTTPRGGITMPGSWQRRTSFYRLRERERQIAFGRFGGFGQRRVIYTQDDPTGMFSLKRQLLAATGLTAPLERSVQSRGGLGTPRFPVVRPPVAAADLEPSGVPGAEPAPLDEFLTTRTGVLHDRAEAEGWKLFYDGDYRGALRAFEAAAVLDEGDSEARIGQVFSYVSMGSLRAAHAALNELQRRDENLFAHDVSMPGRYGNLTAAQQVRLAAQGTAESAEAPTEMKALYTFVLWYMDGREDALRAARMLGSAGSDRAYDDWAAKMRIVMEPSPPAAP